MKVLLQRVSAASVHTEARGCIAEIGEGVLAFVALMRSDDADCTARMAARLARWPIFDDARGRIGESLLDRPDAGLLAVPQFTLAAQSDKGSRADFSAAMAASAAAPLFATFTTQLQAELHRPIGAGEFGALMSVRLTNDGPVTFLLEETNPPRR